MKNRMEYIQEFVQSATQEELADIIFSLYQGNVAGIAGMTGEDYTGVCSKPKTKKEAVERALTYVKIVRSEAWRKIQRLDNRI